MVTLAAEINGGRPRYEGDATSYPVVATDIIYKGAAVGENGSGFARPLVAGDPFLGFALETGNNSAGAAGAINVPLLSKGDYRLPISGLTILSNDLAAVFASDDDTFTLTRGGNSPIGYVLQFLETGFGVVRFDAILAKTREQLPIAYGATFSLGAEATDVRNVTVQLTDINGVNITSQHAVHAWLSSDSSGLSPEPASATLSIADGGSGTMVETSLDNGALLVTNSSGTSVLAIGQTSGADTFFVNVLLPSGRVVTSAAIVFA